MTESSLPSVFHINEPAVVAEAIDGEVVVIHMDLGVYYSLMGSAAYMWQAAAAGVTVPEIISGLSESFDQCPETLTSDVEAFFKELMEKDLLHAGAEEHPSTPIQWEGRQDYATPKIEEFDDMQDLLLADPIHDFDGKPWPGTNG